MNVEKVIERITDGIRRNVDVAVVGLSGGADSFLVTILSAEALGKENVYAVSMPYCTFDEMSFNKNSAQWAGHLGVNHQTVPIAAAVDSLNAVLQGVTARFAGGKMTPLNLGNARARIRMCTLYGIAHHLGERLEKRVRVMGTGNLSEDYIGYDTKGGDALADIFPIGHLLKHEVYEMLEYFRDRGDITEQMINRKPSAGLWEGQCDADELGYTYDQMAPAVKWLFENRSPQEFPGDEEVLAFVKNRHEKNRHKHEGSAVIELRDMIDNEREELAAL